MVLFSLASTLILSDTSHRSSWAEPDIFTVAKHIKIHRLPLNLPPIILFTSGRQKRQYWFMFLPPVIHCPFIKHELNNKNSLWQKIFVFRFLYILADNFIDNWLILVLSNDFGSQSFVKTQTFILLVKNQCGQNRCRWSCNALSKWVR